MSLIHRGFVKALSIAIFLSIIFASASIAQEREYFRYEFPYIEPELSLFGDYRFVDHSGSGKAGEYEYLHNSISLGGELKTIFFPQRLYIELDIKNRKDYFGELRYTYRDVFYLRGINRTLFHNLENLGLLDLDSVTLSPGVDVRDFGKKYGIRSGITSLFLKFKTPDFPAHLFIDGQLIEKKGMQQQRILLGSGATNNIVRTSRNRDIDWQTRNITFGANSHLGPIEIEISHGEKRLDINGDRLFFDAYGDAGTSGATRKAGTFPNNLNPELKGSTNTIKLHTSYTGVVVASATFSKIERENRDSGVKADYLIAAGEIVWMPMPILTFFLKYRHRDRDLDNPGAAALADLCNPLNNAGENYACLIKPSLSSTTDNLSGTVRYRPMKGLNLRAEYSYDEIERENADSWGFPDSTRRNTVSLSADLKVLKRLNLKANYIFKKIGNPAYNTEPDRSDEAGFSAIWMPSARVNTLLSYNILREMRDNLIFQDGIVTTDRDVIRDRLFGSITVLAFKDMSITTSYAYINNKTTQAVRYRSSVPPSPSTDPVAPYKDGARSYSADLYYAPKDNISLDAGFSHTVMKGNFRPSSPALIEPVSVALFSEFKAKETVYYAGGEYRRKQGFILGLKYRYIDFNEVTPNLHDDLKDGKTHIILLTFSKSW